MNKYITCKECPRCKDTYPDKLDSNGKTLQTLMTWQMYSGGKDMKI